MKRLIALGALVLLAGSYADAGILRFAHRHAVKPAAKVSGKVAKGGAKVVKSTAKVAYKTAV